MRICVYFININNGCIYIYHLLNMTEGEVFTGKSKTEVLMYWPSEYIKAEAWGFPCNDRADEVSNKLLYGLFSAIFKKNTIKNTGCNFEHQLARDSLLIPKKYRYTRSIFLSVIEEILSFFPIFCLFGLRASSFYPQLKRAVKPIIARVLLKPYNKYHLPTPSMFNN